MKITCQSCQAKYTIADEKVLGKIVKIRCKKCSSTIVVNGADPSGLPAYGESASDPAGPAAGGAVGEQAWTVNVGDGDQRTMTEAQVAAAYQEGVVGPDTFCWREGMGDWRALREIDVLVEACSAAAPPPPQAPEQGGAFAPPYAPEAARGEYEHSAPASNGAPNGGAAHAAAARRAAGRAPAADLFHGAAQAGGEEEVMTSAPVGAPQAYEPQKPTGARNENSVLFSLSALTGKGSERPPTVPGAEASGLIDIRQLSAQMGRGDEQKRSRVDDIMNLSSGGAFNGALSAPVLTAPAMDYGPDAATASRPPEKNKTIIFVALGAAAFVIVAAVGATFMLTHKGTEESATSATGLGTEAPSSTLAALSTATAPSPAAVATHPEPTGANAEAPDPAAPVAPAATKTAPAMTATPAPVAAVPHAQAASVAAPAPHPAAPAAAATADVPFNMGEAKAKLGAAAAAVQSCKKGDGPVGTGQVVVVFAPNGGAQTATVSGPPFDGTSTGACVAARFRGVRVPPFTGSPFSVSKRFTIN